MSTAAIVGGSLGGALIGAVGSNMAASTQAGASEQAAQLQAQEAQNALDFQKQQYGNTLEALAPYYGSGTNSLNALDYLMGLPEQNVPFNPAQAGAQFANGGMGNLGFLNQFTGSGAPGGGVPDMSGATTDAGPGLQMMARGGFAGRLGSDFTGAISGTPVNAGIFTPQGQSPITGNPVNAGTLTGQGQPPTASFGNQSLQVPNSSTTPGAPGNSLAGLQGFLAQPFSGQFSSPTANDMTLDPGYQFRLQQGMDALQNSAAARGGLLSGGTAKAVNDYAQGSASQEYQNAYNRSFNNFSTNYNIYKQNQNDLYNRFASMAGLGQTSVGQLSNAGLTAGGQIGNTLLTAGNQIGNSLQNAGAARASGYVGGANALGGAVGNIGNLAMLYGLMNQGGGSGGQLDPSILGQGQVFA